MQVSSKLKTIALLSLAIVSAPAGFSFDRNNYLSAQSVFPQQEVVVNQDTSKCAQEERIEQELEKLNQSIIGVKDDAAILIKNGASFETTYTLWDEMRLFPVVEGFKKKAYPEILAGRFMDNPSEYVLESAKSNPFYNLTKDEMIDSLNSRLKTREHPRREHLLKETYCVDSIKSKDTLSIIDMYDDFFSDNSNWNMDDWFPEGIESFEKGGVVIYENNNLELVIIDTDFQARYLYNPHQRFNPKHDYYPPIISNYIASLGIFHTHIRQKDEPIEKIVGPSGADIRWLHGHLDLHPYQVNPVITRIDEGVINVQLSFYNAETENDNSSAKLSVISLGTFEK